MIDRKIDTFIDRFYKETTYERHNALTNVMGIKDYGIPSAFVLCNDNISQKGNITYMPIYMIMFLNKDCEVNVAYKFDLSGVKI